MGRGIPLPSRLGGSVVSSPSGVWGGAPAKNEFDAIYASQNASGGRIISVFIILTVLIKFREILVSHGRSSSFRSFVAPCCSAATAVIIDTVKKK